MLQAVLNSSVAVEELLEIGERLRKGKVRVKDVVKDIDEDEAEFDEQFYVDRVCKIIDKVRKLQRDTEKLEEKLDEKGASEGKQEEGQGGDRRRTARRCSRSSRTCASTSRRSTGSSLQLKDIIVKLDKAEAEIRDCERRAGLTASEIRKTLREMRASPARARAVGKKTMMTVADFEEMEEMIKTAMRKVVVVEEEARVDRARAALDVPRPPRGRAHGRARQERARRGEPAPRRLDREEVHEPRPAVPGPDPGGQHRPDEGGRQVRVQARLQVLDLRDVVDPPGDHPRDRRPGAHDPHPGPHDRDDQQARPHDALPRAGARPRADARRDRRADGAAARQGPQGPEDREGADLARDADRRGGGLAPRRLHRGQDDHLAERDA